MDFPPANVEMEAEMGEHLRQSHHAPGEGDEQCGRQQDVFHGVASKRQQDNLLYRR